MTFLIYHNLLRKLSADGKYVICNLENQLTQTKKNKINIILRHDIDTSDCIKKMSLLLDEDLKYGFYPSVYLRADEEEYLLRNWKILIEEYYFKGIPFGLHSTCYIHENYLEAFQKETRKFISEIGIIPKSFTLHGLGEYCLENRMEFISRAKEIARANDYVITDCSTDFVSYNYVMHDSHWDVLKQERYILAEFTNFSNFSNGRNYLILTHPCYWQA